MGGNVAGSVPDERVVTPGGVTVLGAGNLPAQMAPGASAAYARNVTALLTAVVTGGRVQLDPADEIVAAVWLQAGSSGGGRDS